MHQDQLQLHPIVATTGFAIIAPTANESIPRALTTPKTAGANSNAVPYTFWSYHLSH